MHLQIDEVWCVCMRWEPLWPCMLSPPRGCNVVPCAAGLSNTSRSEKPEQMQAGCLTALVLNSAVRIQSHPAHLFLWDQLSDQLLQQGCTSLSPVITVEPVESGGWEARRQTGRYKGRKWWSVSHTIHQSPNKRNLWPWESTVNTGVRV